MSMSSIHWPISFKWHKWDLLIINHILNYCMTPSNVYDQVKYFSMVAFCSLVLMKINSLKKIIFSITNVCLRFSFHSDWKVSWRFWPETDGVTHLPAPVFFVFFFQRTTTTREAHCLICMWHSVLCWISPLALLRHMHSRWYLKKQVCDYYLHSC